MSIRLSPLVSDEEDDEKFTQSADSLFAATSKQLIRDCPHPNALNATNLDAVPALTSTVMTPCETAFRLSSHCSMTTICD